MTTVLRNLPFFENVTTVPVGNDRLTIKPYQIIVWVSLAPGRQSEWEPNRPRFPTLLDTGLSFNFAIGEDQLMHWAGLHPPSLVVLGHARLSGLPANLLHAQVWLHRNQ